MTPIRARSEAGRMRSGQAHSESHGEWFLARIPAGEVSHKVDTSVLPAGIRRRIRQSRRSSKELIVVRRTGRPQIDKAALGDLGDAGFEVTVLAQNRRG